MKYIIYRIRDPHGKVRRVPIIFPNFLIHLDVAKALKDVVSSSEIIGAGELFIHTEGCHGESTTIGIKSKKERDTKIINNIDYTSGIEGALEIL